MIYQYNFGGRNVNQFPGGGLGCFLFAILLIVGGYYLLQGLYYLLLWAAPALLILAAIINWRVFPDTLKNWLRTMESSPVSGLISLALAILVFPFFSLYLFLKALGYRKLEQMRREFGDRDGYTRAEEEFTDFEEIESTPKSSPKVEEEIPPPPPDTPKKPQNPYDSYFN
ncbi:MAG: hypothetical protein IT261_03005 [Saprospiraceae bacterium]|nr:hypothetical protein [Saprospiraceae bacterium]